MYKWRITVYLKSGRALPGIYIGDENESTDVANKLLAGPSNEIFGMYGSDEKSNLLINRMEVAAMDIRPL